MSSQWMLHSDKVSFVSLFSKNAGSATDAARFILQVLCIDNAIIDEKDLSSFQTDGNPPTLDNKRRVSSCEGMESVDHCLLDLVEDHSTTILILNSHTSKSSVKNNISSTYRSRSSEEIGRNIFVVSDAEKCVSVAIELGGTIVSEVLKDEDRAYWIRSPYEFSFVVIETKSMSAQIVASLYLKAVSTEVLSLFSIQSAPIEASDSKYSEAAIVRPTDKKEMEKKGRKKGAKKAKVLSNRKLWDPITGRIDPFLHPYILLRDQYRLITPNSTDPIPFSNDIFEGKLLFMVRSSLHMDEKYSERFEIDKNMFELQVQGRFKTIPSGYMYLGGEITKKMELGLLTKGLASSMLQFCKTFNASIHHSYGDSEGVELPHIVGPFWSIIDRVVVTPPGEIPPPFIKGFPEPKESRDARRAANPLLNVKPNLDLDSTYSFSFKTRYVDLESWSLVSVPFMKEFKLQTFWNDADLRFVAYFIDPEKVELDSKGFPKLHAQSTIQRLFTLELQNANNHPEWKDNPAAAYYLPQNPIDDSSALEKGETGTAGNDEIDNDLDDEDDEEDQQATSDDDFDSDNDFFDAKEEDNESGLSHSAIANRTMGTNYQNYSSFSSNTSNSNSETNESLSAVLQDIQERQRLLQSQQSDQQPAIASKSRANASSLPSSNLNLSPPRLDDRRSSFSVGHNLAYVVTAVIEVDEIRKTSSNNRRVVYAFSVFPYDVLTGTIVAHPLHSVLRSYREWKDNMPVIKANKKLATFDRWSETEQRRWQLDDSYRYLLQESEKNHATRTKLEGFLISAPHTDSFLHNTILSGTQTTQSPHSPTLHRLISQLQELRDIASPPLFPATKSSSRRTSNNVTAAAATTSPTVLPASTFTSMILSQLESNVCLRTSNFHWSQEHLSVNDTDIVLRRPGKRFGSTSKLTIPLTSVLDVRALILPPARAFSSSSSLSSSLSSSTAAAGSFATSHYTTSNLVNNRATTSATAATTAAAAGTALSNTTLPIQLSDLAGFVITTFPRQYLILIRGGDEARDVWVQALQSAVARAITTTYSSSQPDLNNVDTAVMNKSMRSLASNGTKNQPTESLSDSFCEKWSSAAVSFPGKDSMASNVLSSLPVELLRSAYLSATTSQQFDPQELLATPPAWQLNERVILNARSFRLFELHQLYFSDPLRAVLPVASSTVQDTERFSDEFWRDSDSMSAPKPPPAPKAPQISYAGLWARQHSPVDLVAWLLDLVLYIAQLSNNSSNSSSSNSASASATSTASSSSSSSLLALEIARLWMIFMDGVALLQTISLASLDLASPEAISMFLNLFHLILTHALLVFGPPTSIFKWQSLFRNIAYEAFGDIFTLAELEHNIIKNDMSRPSVNFIAKSFIPTSVYSFALQVRDYRILFALNSASTSNIPYVPIYNPQDLSFQLNEVMRLSLENQLTINDSGVNASTNSINGGNVTITLPQTCQWYAKDFLIDPVVKSSATAATAATPSGTRTPTSREILLVLLPYLNGDKERKLRRYLGAPSNDTAEQSRFVKYSLNIKYSQFEFACQILRKWIAVGTFSGTTGGIGNNSSNNNNNNEEDTLQLDFQTIEL